MGGGHGNPQNPEGIPTESEMDRQAPREIPPSERADSIRVAKVHPAAILKVAKVLPMALLGRDMVRVSKSPCKDSISQASLSQEKLQALTRE